MFASSPVTRKIAKTIRTNCVPRILVKQYKIKPIKSCGVSVPSLVQSRGFFPGEIFESPVIQAHSICTYSTSCVFVQTTLYIDKHTASEQTPRPYQLSICTERP